MDEDIKILFPYCYHSMARGNKQLLIQYIKGFIRSSHPTLNPIRIDGDYVICVASEKSKTLGKTTPKRKPILREETNSMNLKSNQFGLEL